MTAVGESTRRELRVWRLYASALGMDIIRCLRILATNLVGSVVHRSERHERE